MTDGTIATRGWTIGIWQPSRARLDELSEWYAAQYDGLIRFGYVLTGDWAASEDLVQETFVRLYRSRTRVEREGLPAYARKTMVNLRSTMFRKREREETAHTEAAPLRPGGDPAERGSGRDEIWDAIRRLSRQQRAIVALRYYEDLSESEIAATLGISAGSVKTQASRAMAKLRDILEETRSHGSRA